MKIIRHLKQMQRVSQEARLKNRKIGFVPTMGALHAGHLSLIKKAKKECDFVAVSIFVNPAQFGPKEDFKKYPQNLRQDAGLCRSQGVDILFLPAVAEIYPPGYRTYCIVEGLSGCLCGRFRPGHFKGVATVVTKLFNIVQPDVAYFGQKDAQQAIIIKRMAEDLNIPLKIKIMPTMREKDGLAMSSRNVYLGPDERQDAGVLYRALNLAKGLIKQRERSPSRIVRKMRQLINKKKNTKVQYISIVDLKNLQPIDRIKDNALIALAVWIGRTRLIDNIIVNRNPSKEWLNC